MKNSERIKAFREQLEAMPPHKRAGFVDSFHARLIQGDVFHLEPLFEVEEAAKVEEDFGFPNHANRLRAASYFKRGRTTVEDHAYLRNRLPDYFDEQIQGGAILLRSEQIDMMRLDVNGLFDYLFNKSTAYPGDIYPEFTTGAMVALDKEALQAMRTLREVRLEDLPKLREELGERAKIIELKQVGHDLYTEVERKPGEAMQTGKIEFKVAGATPVPGQRFLATTVGGYHGLLKFYLEEAARIAPEGANAYQIGNGLIISVKGNRMRSPLIADRIIGPVNQKDGEAGYHLVPVRFFNVDVDRSQRFRGDWKVKERDAEGNATLMRYDITPVEEAA
jgi:hypothetical protein